MQPKPTILQVIFHLLGKQLGLAARIIDLLLWFSSSRRPPGKDKSATPMPPSTILSSFARTLSLTLSPARELLSMAKIAAIVVASRRRYRMSKTKPRPSTTPHLCPLPPRGQARYEELEIERIKLVFPVAGRRSRSAAIDLLRYHRAMITLRVILRCSLSTPMTSYLIHV